MKERKGKKENSFHTKGTNPIKIRTFMVGTVCQAIVPQEEREIEREYGPFANNSNTRRGDGYRTTAARPSTTFFWGWG